MATSPATTAETLARWAKIRSPPPTQAEPLLQPETTRTTILPIQDQTMWMYRKMLEKLHWTAQEIDFSRDAADYATLSPIEQKLIRGVFAWFGPADEIIMQGLDERANALIQRKEGQFYLRAQADQESVHSEVYSIQIMNILPENEREQTRNAALTDPCVASTADWVRWWIKADNSPGDFFAMMAFTEGVLFSGFFAALQYFSTLQRLPGVLAANSYIARDENIHSQFWSFLVTSRLVAGVDPNILIQIACETVELSRKVFYDILPTPLPGLNADLLHQYVKYMADRVLKRCGGQSYFNVKNPFSFMDGFALNKVDKHNFFESRPTQYQNHDEIEFGVDSESLSMISTIKATGGK